jgi:hypothetical protein
MKATDVKVGMKVMIVADTCSHGDKIGTQATVTKVESAVSTEGEGLVGIKLDSPQAKKGMGHTNLDIEPLIVSAEEEEQEEKAKKPPKQTAKDVDIYRDPKVKQIQVPDGMPLREAAQWLLKKAEQEDKKVGIRQEFDCYPLDGVVAMRQAIAELYGFVTDVDIPGGFFFPDQPPIMVGVPVGRDKIKQVPWGRLKVPGVDGYLETGLDANPFPKFIIQGETTKRCEPKLNEIVAKTKEILRRQSIYKGQAVRLDLSWMRGLASAEIKKVFNPLQHAPQFTIPVESINPDDLVFSDAVQSDIELGLFTPIEHSDHCRRHGIPLKRGVLLAGDPGVGKTLAAYVTAKKCVDNDWTFVYLSHAQDLALGMRFAAQYAPCVLFVEDVDRIVAGEERTEEIDDVLNAMDGVDTKDKELIVVLTTNHLEKIPAVALRPGRCDTLVMVTRPDSKAAARLARLYGRGLIDDKADFEKIGSALDNHIPAEIREAIERAKLAAVSRLAKSGTLTGNGSIKGHVREQDIIAATQAMLHQHQLLEPKDKDKRTLGERMVEILGTQVGKAIEAGASKQATLAVNMLQMFGVPSEDIKQVARRLSARNDVPISGNGIEAIEASSR